jgi:potassium-dependent mechanosensitive channel
MIPPMKSIKVALYLALACVSGASFAQDAPASSATTATPAQILDQARDQLDDIAKSLKSADAKDDAAIDGLRKEALDAQGKAQEVTSTLAPQLEAVTQRLTDFGPAPAKGTSEAPDVAAQRRDLQKQHDSIDSQIKQAKDTATLSTQLAGQLADIKRTQFQAAVTNRVASPLTRDFWVGPTDSFARDRAQLAGLWADVRGDFAKVMTPPNRLPFLVCLICGLLLLTLVRWLIERTVFRLTTNRVPAGKPALQRS